MGNNSTPAPEPVRVPRSHAQWSLAGVSLQQPPFSAAESSDCDVRCEITTISKKKNGCPGHAQL